VIEAVESRTMMSTSYMMYVPNAIVTDIHARGVTTGLLAFVEQHRAGHGVVPNTRPHAGPSSKPASKPAAVHHVGLPAITGIVATKLDANTIHLTWAKADKSADTIVLDYASDGVHYATLGMLNQAETSFNAGGLESGKTYSFRLFAMNQKGMSPASEIVSIVLG
jgi:hypothetical protein